MTADGKISKANIRDVALMCGNCDEPSCRSLIDPPCEVEPGTGNPGTGNIAIDGTDIPVTSVDCANEGHEDMEGLYTNLVFFTLNNGLNVFIFNTSTGQNNLQSPFKGGFDTETEPFAAYGDPDATNGYSSVQGTVNRSGNTFNFSMVMGIDNNGDGQADSTKTITGSGTCKVL